MFTMEQDREQAITDKARSSHVSDTGEKQAKGRGCLSSTCCEVLIAKSLFPPPPPTFPRLYCFRFLVPDATRLLYLIRYTPPRELFFLLPFLLPFFFSFQIGVMCSTRQMEHDRQMALKVEAEKAAARKKLYEVQRNALHAQMREREVLKREVRETNDSTVQCSFARLGIISLYKHTCMI